MPTRSRPATVRDVAARAGVSIATVSRALRGHSNVDPLTRQRVEDAARRLSYRPSGVARSLRLRATRTIGVIVTDIGNPYYAQLVSAVEDAARERRYSVLLADGRREPEREIESLEVLAERGVDGLIIASTAMTQRHRARIRDVPCPVVIVNAESTVAVVPAVLSDNEAGGRLAAQHLLALGHRRLAYLAAPTPRDWVARERVAGVRAALREAGLPPVVLTVAAENESVDAGGEAATKALSVRRPPTALLCFNDLAALGALRAARAMGLAVPADISVVGFDDIEIARHADPPLTTVHQDTESMGRWALASLCERIDRGREAEAGLVGGTPGPTVRLPVRLVARSSTGAPGTHRGSPPGGRPGNPSGMERAP